MIVTVLLYLLFGFIKFKFGRSSLLRVLFWPWFVTWWGAQKAVEYVDRPLEGTIL